MLCNDSVSDQVWLEIWSLHSKSNGITGYVDGNSKLLLELANETTGAYPPS